eukprot:134181-Hanusia_phi.AAC.1
MQKLLNSLPDAAEQRAGRLAAGSLMIYILIVGSDGRAAGVTDFDPSRSDQCSLLPLASHSSFKKSLPA